MYYNSNQASTLKGVILILVGIGLVLGLALIGSDLVNPIKSVAEYQQAQVERERMAQQNEIDLRQYEVLQEVHTQAEVAKLGENIRYLQQAHEQELQHTRERAALELQLLRNAGHAAIAVVAPSLLALSIALSVHIARQRPVPVEATADLWTSERKRQEIEAARQREREQRRQALHEQELHQLVTELQNRLQELEVSVGSNGHEDSDEILLEPFSLASDHDKTGRPCIQASSDAKSATVN
jgi:hypothetical protein